MEGMQRGLHHVLVFGFLVVSASCTSTPVTISLQSNPLLCLDLSGGNTANGSPVVIWDCNGLDNQAWFFDPGSYRIAYAPDPRKCIDAGSNFKASSQLMIWDCNGKSQQKWGYGQSTVYLSDSTRDATFCMDAFSPLKPGNKVQVWNCNQASQQQFNVFPGVSIRVKYNINVCLDLADGKTDNGTPVQVWGCNGLQNQQWIFSGGQIMSGKDSSKCVDAGPITGGTHLWLWDCNNQAQQKWGYDGKTIYLAGSEADASMCMDLSGGSVNPGNLVQVWSCDNCWNQQWIVGVSSLSASTAADASNVRLSTQSRSAMGHVAGLSGDGWQNFSVTTSSCPPQPQPSPTPGPPPGFMSMCSKSVGQYPVFKSSQDIVGTPWEKYFKCTYGEVPQTRYPICLGSFHFIDKHCFSMAGKPLLSNVGKCPKNAGDYYDDNNYYQPAWASWLWHPPPYGPSGMGIPANTWTEVSHKKEGKESSGMWLMYSMGSGIWFNTGKSQVFQLHAQAMKQFCPGCGSGTLFSKVNQNAMKQGYNSLQFTGQQDPEWECAESLWGKSHANAALGIEIVGLQWPGVILSGGNACENKGGHQKAFKAGWNADKNCNCDNDQTHLNCKGFGGATERNILI